MDKIIIRDNQFFDIHAPEYKLMLECCDNLEATFVVVKQINTEQDERIEEIHLDKKQILQLTSILNNFIIQNELKNFDQ